MGPKAGKAQEEQGEDNNLDPSPDWQLQPGYFSFVYSRYYGTRGDSKKRPRALQKGFRIPI